MADNLIDTLKLKSKIIGLIIGGIVVFFVTKNAGFPMMFVKMYLGFTLACFIFFVLLDIPEMKKLTSFSANRNLVITFILFSGIYTGAGIIHPQFDPANELEKINKPPRKELPTGPEAIEAGYEVFQEQKCTNCHKTTRGGSSDRGPHFGNIQLGVYDSEWITEQIVDPQSRQHPGFTDKKSKKAMPDYYGEDIEEPDMGLLLAFIATQRDDTKMPVRGRIGAYKRWSEDPEMIAEGKKMFEGELNPAINCAACHGKDATPLMTGAAEFKNKGWMSKRHKKTFGEMADGEWFESVMKGVPDTAMAPWGDMGLTPYQAWAVISYIKAEFQKNP